MSEWEGRGNWGDGSDARSVAAETFNPHSSTAVVSELDPVRMFGQNGSNKTSLIAGVLMRPSVYSSPNRTATSVITKDSIESRSQRGQHFLPNRSRRPPLVGICLDFFLNICRLSSAASTTATSVLNAPKVRNQSLNHCILFELNAGLFVFLAAP